MKPEFEVPMVALYFIESCSTGSIFESTILHIITSFECEHAWFSHENMRNWDVFWALQNTREFDLPKVVLVAL